MQRHHGNSNSNTHIHVHSDCCCCAVLSLIMYSFLPLDSAEVRLEVSASQAHKTQLCSQTTTVVQEKHLQIHLESVSVLSSTVFDSCYNPWCLHTGWHLKFVLQLFLLWDCIYFRLILPYLFTLTMSIKLSLFYSLLSCFINQMCHL